MAVLALVVSGVTLLLAVGCFLAVGHLHNRLVELERERGEQRVAIANVQLTASKVLAQIETVSKRFGPTRHVS